jgi:putative endonuclease
MSEANFAGLSTYRVIFCYWLHRLVAGHVKMHTVYVLESTLDKSWYIGQTDNLKRRLHEHNVGTGGRTTRIKKGSWKLIYAEAYREKRDALGREKFLKGGSGRKYLQKQMRYYLSQLI